MSPILPAALLLFILAGNQTPAQTPAQMSSQTRPPDAPAVTLHSRAQLVVVDVVVTGSNRTPVHALNASDFTLLEDNAPQTIRSFEEHTARAVSRNTGPTPVMPQGFFTNYSPAPAGSAVNVLLLDTLNTPATDQNYVKDQIRQFLKTAAPGAPIAIFGLTSRLSLLQSFTADPALLKAALNKKTAFSALLDDPIAGGNTQQLSEDNAEFKASMNLNHSTAMPDLSGPALQAGEAQQAADLVTLRARYTLGALNQLARYLAGLPGRKNLLWFSGSFPTSILPDSSVDQPFANQSSMDELLHQTSTLLTRGEVAVYPIDARGVRSGAGDVSQSAAKYDHSATSFAQDQAVFQQRTSDENTTMRQMAGETGGQAFLAENDLAAAVTQAIDAGSNFYTLSYTPSNTHWNGRYRRIQVPLKRSNLALAYRRGYYADDAEAPSSEGQPLTLSHAATQPEAQTGAQTEARIEVQIQTQRSNPMHLAMMRGAPDPTQITLKVRVLPTSDKPGNTLATGNTLALGSRARGPYRSYTVDLAADPNAILFSQAADGVHHSYLQVLTYVYDQDGRLVDSDDDIVRANLPLAAYAHVLAAGLPFHQEISVPVKGDFYLRIGLHDLTGDHVGAVEVPIASVRNLPPAPPGATAPEREATTR